MDRLIRCLSTLFLLSLVGCTSIVGYLDQGKWPTPIVSHTIDGEFGVLWRRDNVFSRPDAHARAKSGILAISASLEVDQRERLIAFDAADGNVAWITSSEIRNALAMTSTMAVSGTVGIASVEAFDLVTGELVWETQLGDSKSVANLAFSEQAIYSYTNAGDLYVLDPETGSILGVESTEGPVYFEDGNVRYSRGQRLDVLKAVDEDTGDLVWQVALPDTISESPVVGSRFIFANPGSQLRSIHLIERKTGDYYWNIHEDVVSNVAIDMDNSVGYFITQQGMIFELRPSDRSLELIATIKPAPLPLRGPESNIGSYRVAFDTDSRTLFVFLGSSAQIFALDVRRPN